jgi:PAS domain S-box-containing protein
MNNSFLPRNEVERLHALESYYILDTLAEDEFDRFTQLIAIICETPISLISLLDEKRQWFKSRVGLEVEQTPRDLAFCKHTILGDEMFQVKDATMDERFRNNDLVTGDPNIRFYAGFPLIDPDGYALGSLCVIDRVPRALTEPQERALKLLAEQITTLIVERKEKEHLANFQKLFNLSDDLVCIGGFDGYFKSINPAFSKMLGYDESYLLKTPVLQMVHPADVRRTNEEAVALRRGEISVNFTNRYKAKNGTYKIIEWTTSPDKDQPFFYSIGRDITKHEEQEAELRLTKEMLEQTNAVAKVGGWEYNIPEGTLYWSSVTKDIHEVPADFVPDLTAGVNFYKEGEDRELIAKVVDHALATGEGWDVELRIVTAKGNELWIRALGLAEMKHGECVRLYGTFQDIDEQKNEEIKLEKSARMIRQQNDRLLNFAHIVSHNLRSHSGNLQMVLEIINDENDVDEKVNLLKHLDTVSKTLNETIENLTEVVKVQTDISLNKIPVKLEASFNSAVNTLSSVINNSQATVISNFDAVGEVDHIPAYLDSIMLNIVSNSIKYQHPDRHPVVRVISSVENGNKYLTFSDNGIGIDLERHGKNMFGMYKTFHKHPDARGIGLFITKNQIEAIGGTIEIASKLGEGTSFKISF